MSHVKTWHHFTQDMTPFYSLERTSRKSLTVFPRRPMHIAHDFLVNLNLFRKLPRWKIPLPHDVEIEIPFPIIDPALIIRVLDCLGIQRPFVILPNAFYGLEYLVGWQSCEFLYATVSYRRVVAVSLILQNAYFDDWEVTAQAGVRLFCFIHLI